jgi:hypothetical protein
MLRLPRPAQDTAKESREECCVGESKDRAVKAVVDESQNYQHGDTQHHK